MFLQLMASQILKYFLARKNANAVTHFNLNHFIALQQLHFVHLYFIAVMNDRKINEKYFCLMADEISSILWHCLLIAR